MFVTTINFVSFRLGPWNDFEINNRAVPVEVEIHKSAILVHIALLWISQPNNQNQSVNSVYTYMVIYMTHMIYMYDWLYVYTCDLHLWHVWFTCMTYKMYTYMVYIYDTYDILVWLTLCIHIWFTFVTYMIYEYDI